MAIIKPQTTRNLKELWVKTLLSRTDKVTKITDGSILNAISYADTKLSQKALKDIALAQSHFYPDSAHGKYLDNIAKIYGISKRFGSLGSSTYVRIKSQPNTSYIVGVHTFKGSDGIVWNLDSDVTIGQVGFGYAKVSSSTLGSETLVEPFKINSVSPIPTGHTNVVNEFKAVGGRDIEEDSTYRQRIKEAINALSRPTRSYLKQVMLKFQPNVLRVFNYGDNGNGKTKLAIATVDGSDLSAVELSNLLEKITPWLSLSEEKPDGLNGVSVELVNVVWQPIDISFRLLLESGYNTDQVRVNIQVRVNKYLDYRTWTSGSNVEWDDILQIVKNTEGVNYVPDQYFFPNNDVSTNIGEIPRIRGFLMLDMDGNLISDSGNQLNPVFYPTVADFSLISTVLSSL